MLICGGCFKVGESFYTQVIVWVNTILNHIDTRTILTKYEGSCMVYRPKWYRIQKYHQIPISYWYWIKMIPVRHWFQPHCVSEYVLIGRQLYSCSFPPKWRSLQYACIDNINKYHYFGTSFFSIFTSIILQRHWLCQSWLLLLMSMLDEPMAENC